MAKKEYVAFPILGRQAIALQDYFFHPFFRGWGADQGLNHVWQALGRHQELDIYVNHLSYHTKSRKKDTVNCRIEAISQHFHIAPNHFFEHIAPQEIERLRTLLSEHEKQMMETPVGQ